MALAPLPPPTLPKPSSPRPRCRPLHARYRVYRRCRTGSPPPKDECATPATNGPNSSLPGSWPSTVPDPLDSAYHPVKSPDLTCGAHYRKASLPRKQIRDQQVRFVISMDICAWTFSSATCIPKPTCRPRTHHPRIIINVHKNVCNWSRPPS